MKADAGKVQTANTEPAQQKAWLQPWVVAAGVILAIAALIRLCYLALPPLHHDEGVNGNFLLALYRNGQYQYDPANYHGPSLYYIALLVTRIAGLLTGHEGLSTYAIRLVTAIFGIALVWLVLQLRRELGDLGTLAAATMVAISPGAVYLSRYFIHEILFVFFSLGMIVAAIFYARTMKPIYLMLLAASTAMLVATKETSVITIAILVLAYVCTAIWERLWRRREAPVPERGKKAKGRNVSPDAAEPLLILSPSKGFAAWRERVGDRRRWWKLVLTAALVFVVIHVCLYSSFFGLATAIKVDPAEIRAHGLKAGIGFDGNEVEKHLQGIVDSVRTYGAWVSTGENAYLAPKDQYLNWMGRTELGTLLLGAAGILIALFRGRNRFGIFVAFYALGELFAYSLIPYKTPWLTLNILLPFWLAVGYAVQEIASAVHRSPLQRDRVALWAGAAIVVAGTGWQSVDLSYFRYDDNSLPYIYAHTRRSFLDMTNEIDKIVEMNHLGPSVGITVMAPEHWPLPWYTRNYPNTGYWGKVVETTEPIIVGQDKQRQEILSSLGAQYDWIGTYDMRPGVILDLYVRRGLSH